MAQRYDPPHGRPRRDDRYERNDRFDQYNPYDRGQRYDERDPRDDSYRGYQRAPSPPRQAYARHDGYDGYRMNDDRRYDGRRNDQYNFRGAAERVGTHQPQPPQSEFTFRANGPSAPKFPTRDLRPIPASHPQHASTRNKIPRRDQGKRGPVGQYGGKAHDSGARGRFRKPPPPHQRDILRRQHGGSTPEQLHGMNQEGQSRFMSIELVSSDEAGSEDGEIDDDIMSEGEGPRKRVKAHVTGPTEQTAPKWSNPEYFTALPPPESGLAPKKDIVQVIRKAKVESAPHIDTTTNAVTENADFISFNMDDNDDDLMIEEEDAPSEPSPPKNAPTGPSNIKREANAKPNDDDVPKKRRRQFDSTGPPPPPPPTIDQLMTLADRMGSKAKPPPAKPKKRKAAEISKGLGDVVGEWRCNETNPTPWCTVDHTRTANVGLRLHKEIADFFEFVRPHDYEEAVRRNLITRVQQAVRTWQHDAKDVEIRSFGSFAAGLYLPTADMDLVAVSPRYLQSGQKVFCQSSNKMYKLGAYLQNRKVAMEGTLTVITKAKVPIIKYTDRDTGIKVDVSFENNTGLVANETFAEWKEKYPAMPVVVVLIKQMLAMRGLNEVYLGGLGGFSIICLVVSMMQHMPELQSGNMDPRLHYGELLLTFLDLYGNKFNVQSTGITMNPPGYFDKIRKPHPSQNNSTLTIVDPNKPDNDISGGSKKILTVFSCFRTAHSEIQRRLAQIHSGENIDDSILGCIWGGNYTSFIQQRNKLDLVSRGVSLSPPSSPEPEESNSEFVPDYEDFVPQEPQRRTIRTHRAGQGRGGGMGKRTRSAAAQNLSHAQQGSRFKYPVPQQPISNANGSYGSPNAYNGPAHNGRPRSCIDAIDYEQRMMLRHGEAGIERADTIKQQHPDIEGCPKYDRANSTMLSRLSRS